MLNEIKTSSISKFLKRQRKNIQTARQTMIFDIVVNDLHDHPSIDVSNVPLDELGYKMQKLMNKFETYTDLEVVFEYLETFENEKKLYDVLYNAPSLD